MSGLVGIAALNVGTRWVLASEDPVTIPATLIVLSLVVLTPLAVQHGWSSRGEFIDSHVKAACRFLTSVGLAGVVVIAVPAAMAPFLPSGNAMLVLPYVGAVALPVAWALFSIRATALALKGTDHPYPRWTVPENILSY